MLLGHILEFGLCAIEKSLAQNATTANGYLALIDVVAHTARVIGDAQHNGDAFLLMLLQHMVERKVDREHEDDRCHDKADGDEDAPHVVVQHAIQQIDDRAAHHQAEEHIAIDRYAQPSQPPGQQTAGDVGQQHIAAQNERAAVDQQHAHCQHHHDDKGDERAQRDAHQHHSGKLEHHHKVGDGTQCGKQHKTAHALAIEHKDERRVDQRRTGLLLQDDAHDRQHDDAARNGIVAPVVQRKTIGAE